MKSSDLHWVIGNEVLGDHRQAALHRDLTGTPLVSTFAFEKEIPGYDRKVKKPVRVVEIDGDPWFVAADVCKALDVHMTTRRGKYRIANTTAVVAKLAYDEVQTLSAHRMGTQMGPGRAAKLIAISESGLYKLIMRSDKPVAKPFQDWVTRTVLPAIRKDGMYVLGEEKVATGGFTITPQQTRSN